MRIRDWHDNYHDFRALRFAEPEKAVLHVYAPKVDGDKCLVPLKNAQGEFAFEVTCQQCDM